MGFLYCPQIRVYTTGKKQNGMAESGNAQGETLCVKGRGTQSTTLQLAHFVTGCLLDTSGAARAVPVNLTHHFLCTASPAPRLIDQTGAIVPTRRRVNLVLEITYNTRAILVPDIMKPFPNGSSQNSTQEPSFETSPNYQCCRMTVRKRKKKKRKKWVGESEDRRSSLKTRK